MNFKPHLQSRKRKEPARYRRYRGFRFPLASRKGRQRQAASGRGRDSATTGEAVPGNTRSPKAPRSIQELLTKADVRAVSVICATACLSLFLLEFVGSDATYSHLFPPSAHEPDPYWVLRIKAWWVLWIVISFVVIPVIAMLCTRSKLLRECNLSFRGLVQHFWIYVGLFVAVFPLIWLVSQTSNFYTYYPMYQDAGRSWRDLLMWEGMYAVQFIALEFFFRGFLVGGLSPTIGVLSVPVSVMPYMMLHFTKPAPEAAASVVAGLVLGWLAWKYKSIWGGVCIHCAVAVSMDLLALSHKDQLPWVHR